MVASIRCYFDTINLKQSDFCPTYFFKTPVFEEEYNNILKNREFQNNNNNNNNNNNFYSYQIYSAYIMFYYKIQWFYQDFKNQMDLPLDFMLTPSK